MSTGFIHNLVQGRRPAGVHVHENGRPFSPVVWYIRVVPKPMEKRMSTLALERPAFRTISLYVLLCTAVVAVPALSHAVALPFYLFDPMRLLLFVAIIGSSRRNALLMAMWMPLLAMLTSGHPVFPKVVLIQGELVLNTLLFFGLAQGGSRFVPAAAVSCRPAHRAKR